MIRFVIQIFVISHLVSGFEVNGQEVPPKERLIDRVSVTQVARVLRTNKLDSSHIILYEGFQSDFRIAVSNRSSTSDTQSVTSSQNKLNETSDIRFVATRFYRKVPKAIEIAERSQLTETINRNVPTLSSFEIPQGIVLQDNISLLKSDQWFLNKKLLDKEKKSQTITEAIKALHMSYGLEGESMDWVEEKIGEQEIWKESSGKSVRDLLCAILQVYQEKMQSLQPNGYCFFVRPNYSETLSDVDLTDPESIKSAFSWTLMTF